MPTLYLEKGGKSPMNKSILNKVLFSLIAVVVILTAWSCSSKEKNGLTVAASAVPHAELLEFGKTMLKQKGIDLTIIVADDYNMPNRALANKEVDANFFQHVPFLQEQVKQFHYPLVVLAAVELEPMGIYSRKLRSLVDVQNQAVVAVPNDPTNEARALFLLQKEGLIELDRADNLQATVLNITKNPKELKFIEVDAAMVPRALDEVDLAAINTNYALAANLSPLDDALVLEDQDSPYTNVIVIREGDENRADIQALKEVMNSSEMRQFILRKYKGAVLPAF